jgi:transposase
MAKRKTRRERGSFNDEYKQQVLELIRVGDKSISAICKDLDLTESTVRRWVQIDQDANGVMTQNSLSETDQQGLTRSRSENKRLKMDREILEKASVGLTGQRNTVSSYSVTKVISYAQTSRYYDPIGPRDYLGRVALGKITE